MSANDSNEKLSFLANDVTDFEHSIFSKMFVSLLKTAHTDPINGGLIITTRKNNNELGPALYGPIRYVENIDSKFTQVVYWKVGKSGKQQVPGFHEF